MADEGVGRGPGAPPFIGANLSSPSRTGLSEMHALLQSVLSQRRTTRAGFTSARRALYIQVDTIMLHKGSFVKLRLSDTIGEPQKNDLSDTALGYTHSEACDHEEPVRCSDG